MALSTDSRRVLFMRTTSSASPITRPRIPASEIPTRGGDYGKLAHWGLIEFEDGPPGTGRRAAGKVRPTKTGAAFALDRQSIQSHVVLFANRRLQLDGAQIGIRDVPNFDYSEVMRSCQAVVSEEALQ